MGKKKEIRVLSSAAINSPAANANPVFSLAGLRLVSLAASAPLALSPRDGSLIFHFSRR